MKIYFLTIYLVTLILVANAQFEVGFHDANYSNRKFDEDRFADLKKTTTIFFYGASMQKDLEKYKQAINKAWSITPVEFKSIDDYKEYLAKPEYSYFIIDMIVEQMTNPGGTDIFYDLDLVMWGLRFKNAKKPETILLKMASIPLYADSATTFRRYKKNDDALMDYYSNGKFYNLNPGMIKCMIGFVNNEYAQKQTFLLESNFSNDQQISKLKFSTLYIPDYAILRSSMLNGHQSEQKDEGKDLLKAYGHKATFWAMDSLSNLMISNSTPLYVLIYVRQSRYKKVMIFNSLNNDLLYYREGNGNKLADSDLEKIL